jgi:hypothetical protein
MTEWGWDIKYLSRQKFEKQKIIHHFSFNSHTHPHTIPTESPTGGDPYQ